jgi:hypothetical protein
VDALQGGLPEQVMTRNLQDGGWAIRDIVSHLRLDSARFMTSAHHLYRSFGFDEIEPYEAARCRWNFKNTGSLSNTETGKRK